jgi:NitT/TauT family transport system substrate-binding protein
MAASSRSNRSTALFAVVASCGLALAVLASAAHAADRVTLGTNWLAEAEQGGFYQALLDGAYAKYGLDVTILAGGPQANNQILLPVGKIDFYVGGDLLGPFDAATQNVPIVAVSAIFQKSPQIVMSHPGVGHERFEDLKGAPIFLGKEFFSTAFQWMKTAWGFSEDDVKPYTYDPAPFIADKTSAQQGYATSEPYAVAKVGGFTPNVFLLDDYGYKTYSTLIETRADLVAQKPDLVQRFVDASEIGWYDYLYGDNRKANEAIKHDNPDMTDEQIAFSIAKMKQYGIVDSGDSLTDGVGVMKPDHVSAFFDAMVKAGVVSAQTNYASAVDFRFAGKKVGLNLRPAQ